MTNTDTSLAVAEQNRATVRTFFAAVDRLDRDALNTLYHDDFSLDYPGNDLPLDREAHWGLMNGYHTGFPDMIHRPDIIVAEGDRAVVRGTILGTNDGPLLGQPATGKRVEIQFMTMITFRDGKIVNLFSLIDTAKMTKQLGTEKVLHQA